MLLKFNFGLFILVELILYDNKLECSFENLSRRCTKLSAIDVGNVRTSIPSFREVRILNLNPTAIDVNMSLLKSNGDVKLTVIHKEGREEDTKGRLLRALTLSFV
jgi:hypothetical protein